MRGDAPALGKQSNEPDAGSLPPPYASGGGITPVWLVMRP
jgi:hypothetical protein